MSQVPTFLSEDEWMPPSLKPLRSPKQWQGQLKGGMYASDDLPAHLQEHCRRTQYLWEIQESKWEVILRKQGQLLQYGLLVTKKQLSINSDQT